MAKRRMPEYTKKKLKNFEILAITFSKLNTYFGINNTIKSQHLNAERKKIHENLGESKKHKKRNKRKHSQT